MSEEYIHLKVGERVKDGDEYSTSSGIWRVVPKCLVGDIIPESSTQWRRHVVTKETSVPQQKKKWFESFFKK